MTAVVARAGTPASWMNRDERVELTRCSLRTGLVILAVHLALYGATLAVAVAPLPLPLNILAGLANGLLIGLIFIIGHDTSHGSYVPGRRWNQVLTRIAFTPCLHAPSLWDVVHNRAHHGRTNLKGHDYVWAPMSKAEYDRASPFRRFLERLYRGPFGSVFYYWGEFWPKRVLLPLAPDTRVEWRRHLPDVLYTLAALALTLAGIVWLGQALAPERSLWLTMMLGWVIPYATWNYLMALSIYLQHTHPRIAWFDDLGDWSFYNGNVRGTTHVELPINIAPLWQWSMEHTAHHVLPSIPIYRLSEAQAKLLERFGHDVVRYTLTPASYLAVTRACKLYDFERRCWTDFQGRPTAPAIELLG